MFQRVAAHQVSDLVDWPIGKLAHLGDSVRGEASDEEGCVTRGLPVQEQDHHQDEQGAELNTDVRS